MVGFCGGAEPKQCWRKKSCETQEVELSGLQTNMHTGGSSSPASLEFVSISLSPPTLVATTTMLDTGMQPLMWGPWPSEIRWAQRDEMDSPLPGPVEPGQTLQAALLSSRGGNPAFLPCQKTGEVSERMNSCWGSPKGTASPVCGEFCGFSFLYAFLINPKLLTKVCNYFLHLEL